MNRVAARQIARHVGMVPPSAPVGRAAELLRATGCPVVPVGDDGQLSGLISESDLMRALQIKAFGGIAFDGNPDHGLSAQDNGHNITVRDVMATPLIPVPADMPITELAEVFSRNPVAAVPVVDDIGRFHGMVSRADLTSALFGALRPASIGGMATPLGVFLTTGTVTAGAGNLALMLTGAVMMITTGLAHGTLFAITYMLDHYLHTRWTDILLSPVVGNFRGQSGIAMSYVFGLAEILGFLVFLRMLPLTGYHSAEHQTVHTVERGEPLELSVVRTMPRPHPRCGTNLVAIFLLMQILMQWVDPLVALIITFFTWKILGMKLQYYFTTKPATDKQLLNGIGVGKELLEKYQEHLGEEVPVWKRIWNMGLPQVVAGGSLTYMLGQLAMRAWEWSLHVR